jgi:voltage-gated potassium channel
VALVLPALRIFRVLRVVRILAHAGRSLSLLRLLTSLNRGMRALERSLGHTGLGYVFALTVLINFGGAAGMYRFENPQVLREAGFTGDPSFGLHSYGEAVWWTAMLLTTLGSDYFPKTNEGRTLCFLLSVYAFSIFGYITATVARILLKGKVPGAAPPAEPSSEVAVLQKEISALRREIAERLPRS